MITVQKALSMGYAITSRRSPTHATRIDRKDWREFMASKHSGGMAWVNCLGAAAADHYRRCFSSDTIVVPTSWIKLLPNSANGPKEFIK